MNQNQVTKAFSKLNGRSDKVRERQKNHLTLIKADVFYFSFPFRHWKQTESNRDENGMQKKVRTQTQIQSVNKTMKVTSRNYISWIDNNGK